METADKTELIEKMSLELEKRVPGAIVSFSQPIELRVAELISGVRSDVAIKLYGDDLNVLKEKADEIVRSVQGVQGAEDVKAEATSGLPQLQIKPDRAAIARYGLNVEDINDMVESVVAGKPAGLVYQGEQRFNLVIRLNEESGRDVDSIKGLLLTAANGARVPLSQVAEIALVEDAAQITREDTRRRIGVELNVRGRDIGSFVAEAQSKIEKEVQLPPGYYLKWGGTFENLQRASERLLSVPIAFSYLRVAVHNLNSIKQALRSTGNPFAIVGGIVVRSGECLSRYRPALDLLPFWGCGSQRVVMVFHQSTSEEVPVLKAVTEGR